MIELQKLLKIESTDYYPLVYIPNHVRKTVSNTDFYNVEDSIIKNKFGLSNYYSKPSTPIKPKEPENYKFVEYEETRYKDGFGSTLFVVIVLVFETIYSLSLGASLFIISLIFLIIASFILKAKCYVQKKSRRVELNVQEKQVAKENYEIKKVDYEKNMTNYKSEMNKYNLYVNEFQERLKPKKEEYIHKKYLQEIKSKLTFTRSNDIIKRGKSEDRFLEFLLCAFEPDDLKINIAVHTNKSAFYPDFLYVSKDKNFCIDIEIDERYDYETKKPIHYIGSDDERNSFFLDKNCFIVRFTEEQVTEQPDKCCLFIKDVVNIITTPQLYALNTFIQNIKPWTYEEAYLQAKGNVRSNY